MSRPRAASLPPDELAASAARARSRALAQGVAPPRPESEPPAQLEGFACPSSRADRPGSVAFAVAGGEYLQQPVPASAVVGLASPAQPTQVFRFTSPCEGAACPNFHNSLCQLGRRVVEGLPEVVSSLPACRIRASCRWFAEQGGAICRRCPQIVTEQVNPSSAYQAVALGPRRFVPLLVQTW